MSGKQRPLTALAAALWVLLAAWPMAKARVRETGRAVSIPLPPGKPENLQRQESASRQEAAPETSTAPSTCRLRFVERGGVLLPTESKQSEPHCTVEDAVTFRSIAMPDGSQVELDAAITVACSFALETVEWVRTDLSSILAARNARLARLTSVGGQACRTRNGVAGAFISEHATGNALDLGGLVLQDGKAVRLTEPDGATRALREAVQQSACKRFTTVLGPGSDSAHKDHIHLDMRKRNRDYKICQWIVD